MVQEYMRDLELPVLHGNDGWESGKTVDFENIES
jgi:hypothetical protein